MRHFMNKQANAAPPPQREGISEKLKSLISSLDEKTADMRSAIISRDVQRIWAVLSEQEALAAEFEQYSCLWKHLTSSGKDSPEIVKSMTEINTAFTKLRKRNKGNMSLIKSFLAAINKSFKKVGMQAAGAPPSVYGRHGRMQYKQASLVLNRVG